MKKFFVFVYSIFLKKRSIRVVCLCALIIMILAIRPTAEESSVMVLDFIQASRAFPRVSLEPADKSLITKLAFGILRAKSKAGIWYQCGVLVKQKDWYTRSYEIAEASVTSAEPLGVNPVGQLATWLQESGLDPCAIGPGIRNYAISKGLLKAKRTTLSYKKDEVLALLNTVKVRQKFPAIDVGLAQVLYPYYTRDATLEDMFSISKGAKYSALEMAKRAESFGTSEPWITWPGYKSAARRRIIHWWVHRIMEITF